VAENSVEDAALRLLEAIYDLSGGKLNEPVPVEVEDAPEWGAAPRAGLEPDSVERDVAVRYLANQGYVTAVGAPGGKKDYELTVAGLDRAREYRGLGGASAPERGGMSDQTQRRLLTVMSIGITVVLTKPLMRLISEAVPERRGVKDDIAEAALRGLTRAAAFVIASSIVRKIALSRR
jgi:hypothetical protein